jgi:predicted O-methyltransferase YrrM
MKPRPQSLQAWIKTLYGDRKMLGMGHAQSKADGNLGLGWLYYSLARLQRAKRIVVIGSYRGFVPMVLARALQDNRNAGIVDFIDPSLVDDFWKDPERVQAHFARFGIENIRHHLYTTQAFVGTDAYRALQDVDVLFVDGYHSHEQARFDHLAFADKLSADASVLFHDSIGNHESRIYGEDKRYAYSVKQYMDELKASPGFQVFDFDYGSGVTLVKRAA